MNTRTKENRPEGRHTDGWPKKGTREPREEAERGWEDGGDISFHFPAVWLLGGEGHYSRKESPTPRCAVFTLFLLFLVHPLSVVFLCVLRNSSCLGHTVLFRIETLIIEHSLRIKKSYI